MYFSLVCNVQLAVMDTAPEWTLDQIAGLAFGVRTALLINLQHDLKLTAKASLF